MGRIQSYLKGFLTGKGALDEAAAERLRIDFKSRYHHFKLLLNANQRSLEIMAEVEEALRGDRPFGMDFVRSRCTRVSTQVFQMVKHLDELAPGKYQALYEGFREIQKRINPHLQAPSPPAAGPLVLPLRDVDRSLAGQVGGKIAGLGEIRRRTPLKVPDGFVVTAAGYRRFLEHSELQPEIDRRIQAAETDRLEALQELSASLQGLVIRAPVPEDLGEAITEHLRRLREEAGEEVGLAVRSSALGEDGAGTSFAGQYRSILNVSDENLLDAYREVVASKYSLAAMTYRLNRGIRDEEVAMCVGCLRMVDAIAGGVMYSRNPVDTRDSSILINSTWGLPKSIVDGSTAADRFVFARGDPPELVSRVIPRKDHKLVSLPHEGISRLNLGAEEAGSPSLTDDQARELARLALLLEGLYGLPQDIEWALEPDGSVVVLQCRQLEQREPGAGPGVEIPEEEDRAVLLRGGVTASPGVAAGPVYVVRKDMDALRFPDGGVLVAVQALPRWAALLSRAVAVVTEQGGVAGHLASVAREFRIPALLGVEDAADRLQDGRWVTVDADGLEVYEGRVESLLRRTAAPRRLMEGSPVFETLKAAAQLVTPLNLLNPDSPQFKPQGCKTLHDITRFCHERSVQEMFRFGKEHRFPERSSKQLFCEVPMQWWVLNLDDGFREEVAGKYVTIDNIVSLPMVAIWEGIVAVPWEGPPPIDGKGFLSVMYEATRNTALTTGGPSQYANRNYFIVSKNFCNLSSRLGFHFSTIEALVGDRAMENYVSFMFKGGAADYERRLRRVQFVRDLLEPCGFRVELRKDTVIARLEGFERGFMESRLRVLGYLTIHTRQLDMVMSNEASVEHYKSKIARDLEAICAVPAAGGPAPGAGPASSTPAT